MMRRLVPTHSMPLAWAVGLAIAAMYLGWTSPAWPHDRFLTSRDVSQASPAVAPDWRRTADGLRSQPRIMLVHDAKPTAAKPQGWSYPFSCCSGFDCREVPDADIVEGARGYEIRRTGELIIMTDTRIKDSPDGKFHWCSVAGLDDSRTICLFVPPRGF